MITIPYTQGIISTENEKLIPKNYVAKHSNGVSWIFFETTEEYENYKSEHFPKEILEGDINE